MEHLKSKNEVDSLIVSGTLLSTLAIESWILINPANLERLLFFTIFISLLIGVLTIKSFRRQLSLSRKFIAIAFIAFIWSVVVILRSERSIPQQIYGDYGRNTGLLLYLCLVIFCIILASINSNNLLTRMISGLIIAGSISTFYGLLQVLGIDFLGWDSAGEITGLFGNSNYQSSFLGISAISILSLLMFSESAAKKKLLLISLLFFALTTIYFTKSIQGFFVFAIGFVTLGCYQLRASKHVNLIYFYFTTIGSIGTILTAGILGFGPLANLLDFKTIQIREFYWFAAINALRSSPFFGYGFDSYGDLYRQYRSPESIVEFGSELVSTAAHNVFLDLAVNGGLPLLGAYLLLIIYTFKCIFRVYSRDKRVDACYFAAVASWVGYMAQTLISMNQVSLAIWGWALMGLIIGYERVNRKMPEIKNQSKYNKKVKEFGFDPKVTMRALAGGIIGLLIILPPFYSEAKFRSAMESADGLRIRDAALTWPRNPVFMVKATEIFRDNNLEKLALEMGEATVREFPYSVYGWRVLYSLSELNTTAKQEALKRLNQLDPLNKQP